MKQIRKRFFSVVLCVLFLLSMLPVWALGVPDESAEFLSNADVMAGGEYLISEGTLEFVSQSASDNGIHINFVSASDGTVWIDLLEMDDDYYVTVYENDWWLTSFNGTDAPDSVEFPVQADGRYSVIFSVVEYHTEALDAWLSVAGSLTYRMSADVPVSDVIQLPHEDPGKILEDAYALEEGMSLSYGATLTGQITSVKTPYDSYYQNISVVMVVPGCEDMPVLCYRLAGEGADTLTIGDTITVSGYLVNYYGTIEFEQGCTLDAVVKGDYEVPEPPEDPKVLVDVAYALKEGENLPYIASLTGKVVSIDTPYDENYRNITVTILVPGKGDKPISCFRLKGEGVDTLAEGDVITVSGILANYHGTIEFQQGCTLTAKNRGPDSLAIVGEGIPGVEIWDPADPAGDMTEVAPYFYQLTLECPANTLMRFKFAGNDMWDDAWNFGSARVVLGNQVDLLCGPGTTDMTLRVDEACTLLFTVDLYPMLYGGNAMLQVNRVDPIGQPRPLVVHVPSSWIQVYAYTWEPASFGDYPGRELQKQDGYYWEAIRNDMENLVLTGLKADGSYQHTNDIYLRPGDDTVTVTVHDDGTHDVCYSGNPDPWGPDSLTLAGSGLPGITEWNPMDTAGDMTEIANNVYQKILDFTAGTTICFRFVANHDWFSGHLGGGSIVLGQTTPLDSTSGSQDLQLVIPEACQLKFTVDLNPIRNGGNATLLVEKVGTRKIKVKAPASWIGVDAYTWDPESLGSFPGTAMQKNGDVFELTVPTNMVNLVLSGMQKDGTRQQYPDIQLEPGRYDLAIDISDHNDVPIYPNPVLSNYRVTGNAPWMGNWDPASDLGRMVRISENEYQKYFVNVTPGFYELKITKDGKWDNAVGNADGSNIGFLVVQTGDVIVTYNELTGDVDVVVDNNPNAWELQSLALMGECIPGVPQGDHTAPQAQMTEVTDNVFEKILDIPAGTAMFFWLIGKDNWNTSWNFGGQIITLGEVLELNGKPDSQPLDLYLAEDCCVKITVDLNPMRSGGNATLLAEKIDVPASTRKLTVYAPDSWQYVNAYTWDPDAFGAWPGVRMQKNGDCYQTTISGTMTNLVINGTKADGVMAMTSDITLQTNGLDVVVYIEEDGSYTVEYEGQPAHARSLAVVVPSASWNNVFVYTWQPESFGAYPGKKLEGNEGVIYREIISSQLENLVISGTFADGSGWHTEDIHLEPGVRPVTVMLREDFTYTIIYDNSISEGDTYRVVGNAAWMGNWDCASDKGLMEQTSEGVYQKHFKNVQPGSYEFKITRNGTWDDAIGDPSGANFVFEVQRVSDVVVTYSFDAGDIFVTCEIIPLDRGDVTGDGQLNLGDVAKLYAHIRSTKLLDAAVLDNADFNGDGKVNIGDTAALYTYIIEQYMG